MSKTFLGAMYRCVALFFLLMLAACGGGGSKGPEIIPSITPFDLGTVTSTLTHSDSIEAFGTNLYKFTTGSAGIYTVSLSHTDSDLSWILLDHHFQERMECDNFLTSATETCQTPVLGENTIHFIQVDEWDKIAGTFILTITPPITDPTTPENPTAPVDPKTPIANAGPDQDVTTGTLVTLNGRGSSDVDGGVISFAWSVISKPEGSEATLSGETVSDPTFITDLEGAYIFQLVVNDGTSDSGPATVKVTAYRPIDILSFRVVDAEYSKQLNKIVMVSAQPLRQLHIYDPIAKQGTSVDLNLAPTCVSVSPDGLHAAVGHNGWISYVNISTGTLEKTIPVSTDVFDIVLSGNGFIHAFPRIDQWEYIRSVRIEDGTETLSTGRPIRAGTRAKLHPSGDYIYGADNGLSPSDIEKYNIMDGPAAYMYDSPYHGHFQMCGDLWMSEDGFRIFTRCGNVFRTSEIKEDDMRYNGALEGLSMVRHLDHSHYLGKVAVIPDKSYWSTSTDTEVQIFNYDFLTYQRKKTLPYFLVNGTKFSAHGKNVFFNNGGTDYFVIVQANASSGMLLDYGIVTYSID
jgi:chitinase